MSLLFETTPDGAGRYLDWIIDGLAWTLFLALGAWTVALVVGTLIGVIRTLPGGILPGFRTRADNLRYFVYGVCRLGLFWHVLSFL